MSHPVRLAQLITANLVSFGRKVLLLAWLTLPALAHEPITTKLTWTNEICRLMDRHCSGCHKPGGRAMPLLTYEDVRPWAKAIRDEVLNRRMPPWDAVSGVGSFRNDRSLSQPELSMIVQWVEGGAPEGDGSALEGRHIPGPSSENRSLDPSGLRVRRSVRLSRPLRVTGLWADGPLDAAAILPDGRVERLIWVRTFHPQWNRIYWLREPLAIPRGSRVIVHSDHDAAVHLLTSQPPAH